MIALRRFVAGILVLASIVGVVMLQRSRPVHSGPPSSHVSVTATMPFVPKGEFVTSAWFCAGVPIGGPQSGGSAIVANPSEVRSTGRITTFTDAAGCRGGRHAVRRAGSRHRCVRSGSDAAAGHLRLGDGRDLRGRGLRRATRRQRIGQRGVTVLQLHVVVVVLRRRLHRRGQQRGSGHHQPVPVQRHRQHPRGHQYREPRPGHTCRACSSRPTRCS